MKRHKFMYKGNEVTIDADWTEKGLAMTLEEQEKMLKDALDSLAENSEPDEDSLTD
jgi:hypothetical protein